MKYLQHLWALPIDSKHNEGLDFCVDDRQQTKPIALYTPCACMRGIIHIRKLSILPYLTASRISLSKGQPPYTSSYFIITVNQPFKILVPGVLHNDEHVQQFKIMQAKMKTDYYTDASCLVHELA